MRKNDGWVNALFALVFIAVPAILLFYFYLPSWSGQKPLPYGYIWLIAIIFWIYVGLLSFLLIKFQWLALESLNFNVPISVSLMLILITSPLPLWATALFVIGGVLTAIPVNIYTTRFRENRAKKPKNKSSKNN